MMRTGTFFNPARVSTPVDPQITWRHKTAAYYLCTYWQMTRSIFLFSGKKQEKTVNSPILALFAHEYC